MDSKCYLVFFLSLLMDTNAMHFKSRANFHEIIPCTLTGGSLFAVNRIWERPCKTRRDLYVTSMDEFASRERGPPRDDNYDPTYGYEPYWEWGDWVFDKVKQKDNATDMCGSRCPKAFLTYGKICGVNKKMEYQTFDNYCDMKNKDCDGYLGWKAIYKGMCVQDLYTYPTDSIYVVSQVDKFITAYRQRTPSTTIRIPKGVWLGS